MKNLLLIIVLFLAACGSDYSPKPRAYFRIDLPTSEYQEFDSIDFPYRFEYSKIATIDHDRIDSTEKYWINIAYPEHRARIHLSYKISKKDVAQFWEDARSLAYKHSVKADGIDENVFLSPNKKVYGVMFDISGNAASSVQFFVTDSTEQFLRGALYFTTHPNKDSLAPVIDYIKDDIIQLINTFEWLEK